eukprot:CAMPEP_0116908206 /NCGR_PEP_ID=MMETSP0467-20121206/13557_1 /TAXON_ID=283647 /ORGANISM="Mesodinium pulex, Strain SPMC105" /LENGTH=58 /DNA_ID=CAMNT_0004583359 /DNA_START=1183 /DNA_END=1359 /DNA_ORIENTATION=+
MEEDRKRELKLIVENYKVKADDIVSDKGGGVIFLLHGPPGTGKTLTVEAAAETLKKPI